MTLSPGVPGAAAYARCVDSPLFARLESFSRDFLRRHRTRLLWYSLRWSEDPLNHPTRRWEYPFVAERLEDLARGRVLDAGSGITFFPYYLMQAKPDLAVTCCDRDAYVGKVYARIDRDQPRPVAFKTCDLRRLPFPDGHFDAVYCISVLEHTGDWDAIVREFRRVLKPGGRLLVTYDISLDGGRDIPLPAAESLHRLLSSHLAPIEAPPVAALGPDVYISDLDPRAVGPVSAWSLYRWLLRLARSWLGGGAAATGRMTIYCGSFARRDAA